MSPAELHLPDLPEVAIRVGGDGAPPAHRRAREPLWARLWSSLLSYLPLLLMGLLALASWWLVKQTPRASAPPPARPLSQAPDYTMSGFTVERFDAQGRLALRLQGAELRHYPADDRIEIDDARIQAVAPDGRVTHAVAQRARAQGDGSELRLSGGAEVRGTDTRGVPLVVRSEYLHLQLKTERLRSTQPVQVLHGDSRIHAAGIDYEQATQAMRLAGPVRAVLDPRAARR